MTFLADAFLAAGALGAGIYCFVLSRRLARFTDLDSGMGAAVALLSQQVDELNKALQESRRSAQQGGETLADLTHQAQAAAKRLELMMASMHDLPPSPPRPSQAPPPETTFVRHKSGGAGA